MLESGYVILQYQDVPADQMAALANLAGNLVTAAPPAGPLPTPVVATAWTLNLVRLMAPAALSAIGPSWPPTAASVSGQHPFDDLPP